MDEEIIDRVGADTLEVGDMIEFWDGDESLGVQTIKSVEDDATESFPFITVTSEDGDENYFMPDAQVSIYGYTVVEV